MTTSWNSRRTSRIIERAGHNAHSERPADVMEAVRDFIPAGAAIAAAAVASGR